MEQVMDIAGYRVACTPLKLNLQIMPFHFPICVYQFDSLTFEKVVIIAAVTTTVAVVVSVAVVVATKTICLARIRGRSDDVDVNPLTTGCQHLTEMKTTPFRQIYALV